MGGGQAVSAGTPKVKRPKNCLRQAASGGRKLKLTAALFVSAILNYITMSVFRLKKITKKTFFSGVILYPIMGIKKRDLII